MNSIIFKIALISLICFCLEGRCLCSELLFHECTHIQNSHLCVWQRNRCMPKKCSHILSEENCNYILRDEIFRKIDFTKLLLNFYDNILDAKIYCYWHDNQCLQLNHCSDVQIVGHQSIEACERAGCQVIQSINMICEQWQFKSCDQVQDEMICSKVKLSKKDFCFWENNQCRPYRIQLQCKDFQTEIGCFSLNKQCIWDTDQCRPKTCEDVLSEQVCNNSYMNMRQCFFEENKCLNLDPTLSCSERKQQSSCIKRNSCYWDINKCQQKNCEQYCMMDGDKIRIIQNATKEVSFCKCDRNGDYQLNKEESQYYCGQMTNFMNHWKRDKCTQCSLIGMLTTTKLITILFAFIQMIFC